VGSVITNSTKSLASSSAKSIVENGKSLENAVNTSFTKIGQLPVISQVKDATTKVASQVANYATDKTANAFRKTADAISSKGGSRRKSRRRKSKLGKRRKSRSGKRRKTKRASKKSKRTKRSRRKTKRSRRRTRRGGNRLEEAASAFGRRVHELGNVGINAMKAVKL
jgi:hypothetical protein